MKSLQTTADSDSHKDYAVGPVLLVTPWYKPTIGGVAAVADRLRRLVSRAGVEVHLLVCEKESPRHHIESDPTVKNVWRFEIPAYAFYRPSFKTILATLARGPGAFWRIYQFVRKYNVRTIVLLYPIEYVWPFLLIRYAGGCRLIASCHGNDILKLSNRSTVARWLFRRVLQYADAITVPAIHLPAKAQELFPERPLPIQLIPNCVDIDHFVPCESSSKRSNYRPTLVHISTFTPRKRTLDIIEAFALAAISPESRLIMVGAGPDLEAAIELSRSLGMGQRVEFVGTPKDIRPFLWQADLLVMASDEESGPLTLLEAMACEIPWISTPWGIAAMLPPGECGLVVPSRSPQKLAAVIAELINDPQRRLEMGRRGRRRAELDFGEENYLAKHLRLIKQVELNRMLQPHTSPPPDSLKGEKAFLADEH